MKTKTYCFWGISDGPIASSYCRKCRIPVTTSSTDILAF